MQALEGRAVWPAAAPVIRPLEVLQLASRASRGRLLARCPGATSDSCIAGPIQGVQEAEEVSIPNPRCTPIPRALARGHRGGYRAPTVHVDGSRGTEPPPCAT